MWKRRREEERKEEKAELLETETPSTTAEPTSPTAPSILSHSQNFCLNYNYHSLLEKNQRGAPDGGGRRIVLEDSAPPSHLRQHRIQNGSKSPKKQNSVRSTNWTSTGPCQRRSTSSPSRRFARWARSRSRPRSAASKEPIQIQAYQIKAGCFRNQAVRVSKSNYELCLQERTKEIQISSALLLRACSFFSSPSSSPHFSPVTRMLEEPANDDVSQLIKWSSDGTMFSVVDPVKFASKVLPHCQSLSLSCFAIQSLIQTWLFLLFTLFFLVRLQAQQLELICSSTEHVPIPKSQL